MSSQIYFAYGSNLNKTQMKLRCEFSREVAPAKLPGYKLAYRSVLTIVPQEGGEVMGALYRVSKSDIRALDRYEGWPHLYSKKSTWVTIDGRRRKAFFYIMNGPLTECPPDPFYRECCEEGYADWGLDRAYLDRAEESARDAWRSYAGYGWEDYDDDYLTIGKPRSRRKQDLWWDDDYTRYIDNDYYKSGSDYRYYQYDAPSDPSPDEVARWVDEDEAYEAYLREKCQWTPTRK